MRAKNAIISARKTVEIQKNCTYIRPAKHSDRSQMDALIEPESDSLYLFDRGYVDYLKFDQYCSENVRFITRLKSRSVMDIVHQFPSDPKNLIHQDAEVILGKGNSKMYNTLRIVQTEDGEGNEVTIVTNCFDLSAKEISDLYRYRWKIETFFKWMKQHLKIKTFYGKSVNAVTNQIWIALIVYCLLQFMKLKVHYKESLLKLKRVLESFLFRSLDSFVSAMICNPSHVSKERRRRRKKHLEDDYEMICCTMNKMKHCTMT